MQNKIISTTVGCVAALWFCAGAIAQEPPSTPAATAEVKNPLGAKVVDINALAKQRGGTDPGTLSDMKLNGVVSNNSASNLTTGNNSISDGAFAGMSGVPLVVQNSGNNVLIQSATIINVQVK
jgi:hypothetical protein